MEYFSPRINYVARKINKRHEDLKRSKILSLSLKTELYTYKSQGIYENTLLISEFGKITNRSYKKSIVFIYTSKKHLNLNNTINKNLKTQNIYRLIK